MTYQALARKWRPRTFAELVGQAHVVRALSNALDQGRVHHAFLFTGTRGVGKTTVARILAKCLNCERGVGSTPCGECSACVEIDQGRHVDLIEVDAASRAKVDETRDLMSNVQFAPAHAAHKIYLIDEVHMFSDASFNALLKTLEEPPPHVKFLLATTDPQRMPVTVLSRCLQFSLKRLPLEQIAERIDLVLREEDVPSEPAAVRMLARAADGSLRDALSLLDQAIAHGGGRVDAEPVRAMLGLLDRGHVQALIERLAAGDGAALLAQVEAMAGEVADYGQALAELLAALKQVAVVQAVPEAAAGDDDEIGFARAIADAMPPEEVQLCYQIGLIGRRDLPLAPDPRTGFEMTLLRMLAFTPQRPEGAAGAAQGGATAPGAAPAGAAAPGTARPGRAVRDAGTALANGAPCATGPAADWPGIVAALRLQGLARELAANCELVALEASRVRLRLAPAHRQLGSGRGATRLEEALSQHFGRELTLDVEVGERRSDTPAEIGRREADRRTAEAVRALEGDPGARAIVDAFDGSIEPGSVQPVD